MKNLFLLFTLFCVLQSNIFSQAINGKVLNERGAGAANVKVSFKNKANKVETRSDGSFHIVASKLPDTLIFTSPKFEPYKVVVTEKTLADPNFEIVLLFKRNKLALSGSAKTVDIGSLGYSGIAYTGRKATSEKMAKVEYDTVIAFDPDTYEERIKVVPKSSSGSYSFLHDLAPDGGIAKDASSVGFGGLDRSIIHRATGNIINGKTFMFHDSLHLTSNNVSPKSKLLTAGEVNDFLKWEMWKDLTEDEFSSFSEYWGIKPQNRFCVQLTNATGDAIVGEPVFLKDRKSDKTMWRAITDNTGKAELWANLFEEEGLEKLIIQGDGFLERRPVLFQQGINHIEVNTSCQSSNLVDIAFVVDATGSMQDELEFLKLELEEVIRNTFDKFSNLDLRAASVFYRDFNDEYVTRHVDFNNDLLKVLNFIKLQSASGGGDNPEAVDSALHVTLHQLKWSQKARTKLLFLLSDAPPHDYAIGKMKTLIEEAASLGIRIVPLACSGSNKNYEYLQRSMALATNGTYACLTNHSGIGGHHEEPTTDSYKVELLNNLLQRFIEQSTFVPECNEQKTKLELEEIPVAFATSKETVIKSFPNPTAGKINVELSGEMAAIYLTDFTGKILQRLAAEKPVQQLDLTGYPSAIYFLTYLTKDGKKGTERIVLQRG